jgi:hypothetical protein
LLIFIDQNTSYWSNIGQNKISVADMLVQIYRYRQRYRLGEYICIFLVIGRTHIGQTLLCQGMNHWQYWVESAENEHVLRKSSANFQWDVSPEANGPSVFA